MLQPSTVVTVDCQEQSSDTDDNIKSDEGDNSAWQLPLVLASLNLFKQATDNKNNESVSENTEEDNAVTQVVSLGCSWTEWASWSSCSITCGGKGHMTRSRSQTGSRVCTETDEETKDCHVNLCPVDCEMSAWSQWSMCSTTCGTGFRTRFRNVTRQSANWGKDCPTNLLEQEPCLENECQVNGGWTSWSHWGYCSESCGSGSRSRSRTCTDPVPQYGGEECIGANLETKECFNKVCPPVDGSWSPWSRWTQCNKSCGWGEQRRVRTCTDPVASHGGRECSGDRFQNNKCMLRRCPWEWDKDGEKKETEKFNVTSRTEIEKVEKVKIKCSAPPTVLGFLDPSILFGNMTEVTNSSKIAILPGYKIIYKCSKGRVIDSFTNRRSFVIECNDDGEYDVPKNWPQCRPATHCVGPVARPQPSGPLYLPVPRRDAVVNTAVRYTCKQNTGISVHAGCFYDGRYRYETSWPNCNSTPQPDLCSDSSESENSNVIIAVPRLEDNSHGWLSSPGYPELNQKSSSCSWSLTAPHGYVLAVGVEDIRVSNNNTNHPLEISEPGVLRNKIVVKESDLHRTFISKENMLSIKSVAGVSSSWKISYLVVPPT